MQAKLVTKIDANPLLSKHTNENALLRVAAYCRVSTDSDDQLESYKAQVAHYSEEIAKNPRWRFVDIYADEGITGTQDKKRKDFMRMIRDCNKGKIDLILTKSVARFARNTVDSLKYVRQLKALGVGVFFEEQNLDSLKTDSEMLIGFHSVMAQAESENISANVRWGIRQRMKSGTFAFRYNILGYRKGADGQPEIVPEEAEIIKKIYELFLFGYSIDQIKEYLESNEIKTQKGKSVWEKHAIRNILTNERYTGDMLLQKTFTENPISKKVKKNRGEMAKYLVLNNHPAIIGKDTFKSAQMEMAKRSNKRVTSDLSITGKGKHSGKYALTDLLICGECGSPYRRRVWAKKGKSKIVWRCLSRLEHGTEYCKHSISVDEIKLNDAVHRAMRKVIEQKDAFNLIFAGLSYAVTGDDDILDASAIEQEIKTLGETSRNYIAIMASTEGDKERYKAEIININKKITALRGELEKAKAVIAASEKVNTEIEQLKKQIADMDNAFEMTDDLILRRMVEYIRVMAEGKIIVTFKGGLQIEEDL